MKGKYHVGCGMAGIYAGTLKANGEEWISKSDVTDEALAAVAQYLLDRETVMTFTCRGKNYVLAVSEPCDDAISRQALLEEIEKVCFSEECIEFRINRGSNGQRDYLISFIERMPSVHPQEGGE